LVEDYRKLARDITKIFNQSALFVHDKAQARSKSETSIQNPSFL
jgi:hypothetical protein